MSTAPPDATVREGDVIADKYRVERVLGAGGMGVVVAAMHLELDERVALKFLLPEGARDPQVAARFAQEARAAAKIKSEHVARVIDVGRLPTGAPYMVMEYLSGEDLERLLASRGPLPVEAAVGYVLQALEAIAEAHAIGIVHRDLKPANLFVAHRPSGPPIVKVLDFGISKTLTPSLEGQLTKTSAILGSPFYMSPEQLNATKTLDHRADIWSLGVVLYQLLANELPFHGDTMPQLVGSILQAPPAPLEPLRPGLPAPLVAAIARCLEKDPAARFPNVQELALALAPFSPALAAASVPRIAHVLAPVLEESAPTAPSPGLEPAANAPLERVSGSSTVGPVSKDSLALRASGRRRAWVVGSVSLALVVTAALSFVVRAHGPTEARVMATASPPSATATAGQEATSTSPLPPSTGVAQQDEAPPAPPSSAAPAKPASPAPTPARAAPHASSHAPKPPPVDCDPPYVLDSANHRQYKPECLR